PLAVQWLRRLDRLVRTQVVRDIARHHVVRTAVPVDQEDLGPFRKIDVDRVARRSHHSFSVSAAALRTYAVVNVLLPQTCSRIAKTGSCAQLASGRRNRRSAARPRPTATRIAAASTISSGRAATRARIACAVWSARGDSSRDHAPSGRWPASSASIARI